MLVILARCYTNYNAMLCTLVGGPTKGKEVLDRKRRRLLASKAEAALWNPNTSTRYSCAGICERNKVSNEF